MRQGTSTAARRPARVLALAALAAAGLLIVGCGSSATQDSAGTRPQAGTTTASPAPETAGPATSSPGESAVADRAGAGRYVDYERYAADPSAYASGRVVLFFHATWCHDCQTTDDNLRSDPASLPGDLTVVQVDYDHSTDLKKEYGVTQQWTFVSIDDDGTKLKAFTGTYTGTEIADKAV